MITAIELICVPVGILPATMAMMIPMILGRRKRDLTPPDLTHLDYRDSVMNIRVPTNKRGVHGSRLR